MRILAFDLGEEFRGGQKQTLSACQEMARRGITVGLCAVKGRPLAEEARKGPPFEIITVRAGAESSPGVLLDLSGAAKKFRPDVLWSGDACSHGALVWARVHQDAPLAVHRRVTFPPKANMFSRMKYNAVRRFLTVSRKVTEVLVEFGVPESKIRVVPDGLPEEAFLETVPPPATPFRLIHVGAFDGMKGQEIALEVLARIRARGRDAVLVFLGDGAEKAKMQSLAYDLDVMPACAFKGHVGNVAEELAKSHLLLHPSQSEGASMVLLEAMAAGCPVLAHDIGGLREVVCDGRAGQLIFGTRPQDWETAVLELMDSPTERRKLIEAGRREAAERTIAGTVDILLHEFRQLVEGFRGSLG